MNLAAADRPKLAKLLGDLAAAVEELLLGGLTTASGSTRQTIDVAFREASRLRLLRLGGTLRVANEELGRFTSNSADFSRKRLFFFLSRTWLLSRGLGRALTANDDATFDKLLWTPPSEPVAKLDVVTLGVGKKATSAFVAFEFRLRCVNDAGKIKAGQRLVWSCVFPTKPGVEIPAEGFLHLPQKQKFNASVFLDRRVIEMTNAAIAIDEGGQGRVTLGDVSTVKPGAKFEDWGRFQVWDVDGARSRIEAQKPGPLDLPVELQEEVVLKDWEIGESERRDDDGPWVHPIRAGRLSFDAVVSDGLEGKALTKKLEALRKKKRRPPLFGVMHYERCRLMLHPMTTFGDDGPEYLTISDESIDRAALLKALKLV